MTHIAKTLLTSAFVFLGCFAALVMCGFEVPTALRATSVVAATHFMARLLNRSKARDRALQRATSLTLASKVAGGFGAGIAAGAAFASLTGDDCGSSLGDGYLPQFGDDAIDAFDGPSVNPANGLPMVGCVDVMGNPHGFDFSAMHDPFSGSADSFSIGGGFNNSSF